MTYLPFSTPIPSPENNRKSKKQIRTRRIQEKRCELSHTLLLTETQKASFGEIDAQQMQTQSLIPDVVVEFLSIENPRQLIGKKSCFSNLPKEYHEDIKTKKNELFKMAVQNHHVDVMKILMQDPDVDITYGNQAPIRQKGNIEMCVLLMEDSRVAPAYGDVNAWMIAITRAPIEIVKYLMNDSRVDLVMKNRGLRVAAHCGRLEVVDTLLQDPEIRDDITLLCDIHNIAHEAGKPQVIELLCQIPEFRHEYGEFRRKQEIKRYLEERRRIEHEKYRRLQEEQWRRHLEDMEEQQRRYYVRGLGYTKADEGESDEDNVDPMARDADDTEMEDLKPLVHYAASSPTSDPDVSGPEEVTYWGVNKTVII